MFEKLNIIAYRALNDLLKQHEPKSADPLDAYWEISEETVDAFWLKNLSKRNMIKEKKIEGMLDLKGLKSLLQEEHEFLDISEAEMGFDAQKWEVCLGWSHSGPVYGNSRWRDVEVLKRLLEQINAHTILLPDDVQRRHINDAKKKTHIKQLQVRPTCRLFTYEDGKLMNKKKTFVVFDTRQTLSKCL